MTSANGIIDRAARNAEKLPLGQIVAAMLGVATAFFCFAMPQRVLDTTLGTLGLPVPVGGVGRLLFVLCCAALAAGLGWLAVTVAASSGSAADVESEIDLDPPQPRRRSVGPSDPREALGAPLPALLAVRRGDGHPDAPPRRPIFADHDLPVLDDDLSIEDAETAPRPETPPTTEFRAAAADVDVDAAFADSSIPGEPAAAEAEPQPASIADGDAGAEPPVAIAAGEPLDLTDTLPGRTEPSPPAATMPEPTDETLPPTEETPPSTDEAPPSTDEAPPSTDETPLSTDETPLSTGETPPSTEETPLTVGDTPPAASETPVPAEETPPEASDIAMGTGETLPEAAATPEPIEATPLAAATPQPAEQAEQASTVVETPAPAEEAAIAATATPPVDDAPAAVGERPLAELMARLETGLDKHAGDLPPPPADKVTPLHEPTPAPDDALRNALEALQRLAERQR